LSLARVCAGTLPGGVTPEAVERITSNQEIMGMMAHPRLQALMKAVMSNDQQKIGEFMTDAEVITMMQRFQQLATEMGIDPMSMYGDPKP
jgi:hypothetical protein